MSLEQWLLTECFSSKSIPKQKQKSPASIAKRVWTAPRRQMLISPWLRSTSRSPPPNTGSTIYFDPDGDVSIVFTRPACSPQRWWSQKKDEDPTKVFGHEYPSTINHKEHNHCTHNCWRFRYNCGTITTTMVVSSKLMRLHSRVFNAMLRDTDFAEGTALQTQGKVLIPLDDDDGGAAAFAIILYIVHGRHNMVPKALDVFEFTDIAHIVDKYSFHQVVEPFATSWTSKWGEVFGEVFRKVLSKSPKRDKIYKLFKPVHHKNEEYTYLIHALFICWVFRLSTWFRLITQYIEHTGNYKYDRMHRRLSFFPIMAGQKIADKIQTRRQEALGKGRDVVQGILDDYDQMEHHPLDYCLDFSPGYHVNAVRYATVPEYLVKQTPKPYPNRDLLTILNQMDQWRVFYRCRRAIIRECSDEAFDAINDNLFDTLVSICEELDGLDLGDFITISRDPHSSSAELVQPSTEP